MRNWDLGEDSDDNAFLAELDIANKSSDELVNVKNQLESLRQKFLDIRKNKEKKLGSIDSVYNFTVAMIQ